MSASFTVFLCSTFSDLSHEREAVLDAVRRLKVQHDSMEFFGARTEQPIETCLEEVRGSDVIVVIVAHQYGSIVPDLGISYSEAEYNEGFRLQRPCLVYIRDDNVPILPKHMERDPEKLRLLERWKDTLQSRHTPAFFEDGGRLAVQVAVDLGRTIQDLEGVAKVRATARNESATGLLADISSIVNDAISQGVPQEPLLAGIRSSVASLLVALGKREPRVFLSYARIDLTVVRRVAEELTAAGLQVWSDQTLKVGDNWSKAIRHELSAADFFVYFISPNSVASAWIREELYFALESQSSGQATGPRILPVLLQDADVPPLLRQFQWCDMRDGDIDRGVQELVAAIRYRSPKRPPLV